MRSSTSCGISIVLWVLCSGHAALMRKAVAPWALILSGSVHTQALSLAGTGLIVDYPDYFLSPSIREDPSDPPFCLKSRLSSLEAVSCVCAVPLEKPGSHLQS